MKRYSVGKGREPSEKKTGFNERSSKYPWLDMVDVGDYFIVTDREYEFMMYTVNKRNQRLKARGSEIRFKSERDEKNRDHTVIIRVK